MSGFDLPLPDWDFTPEKHVYEAPPRYTERQTSSKVTEDDIQAEANRRTGDTAIYLYYIGSVGWIPTIIFIVSIIIFIFGISFPSKFSHSVITACQLTIFQRSGSKCGRSIMSDFPINALGIIWVYTLCSVD